MSDTPDNRLEKATFGAGCFWGVEEAFRKLKGVVRTEVGYSGGSFENPTYEDVCRGNTGHAEALQITYDSSMISYEDLLNVFWSCHNPTTLNRQGPDVGKQYRSVIFFHNPEQKATARESKEALDRSKKCKNPVVTEIAPAATFYRAEESHQQYLLKRGLGPCHPLRMASMIERGEK